MMEGQLVAPPYLGRDGGCSTADNLPQECKSGWYFSRKGIENNSPSRKDGIDLRKETELQLLYCSFLQDLGMRLRASQVTIAIAIMFCHRFYLHQSLAKNDWQTVATVCMFLASKVEDTPIFLERVIIVAYEMIHRRDAAATQKIRQKAVFEKQKALILTGERLVLSTIRFDFNIQLPYKPLIRAMNKFGMTQKDLRQSAWNFVNDWLRTTLYLQYKPHYIAAGTLFITAKLHNVKLPSEGGYVWWHEFDVTPHQLDVVVQEMMKLLGYKRSVATQLPQKPTQIPFPKKEEAYSSPDSCVLSRPGSTDSISSSGLDGEVGRNRPADLIDHFSSCCNPDGKHACVTGRKEQECQARDPEKTNVVVDNGQISSNIAGQARTQDDQALEDLCKINLEKIKELMKRKKRLQEISRTAVAIDDDSEDAWIERELEAGIELAAESLKKKQKLS